MFDYPVNVHRETGSVWISSDDVPELSGAGDDEEAAMLDGIDGLETALCLYVERRLPIPMPSPPKTGQSILRLPALTTAKAALWNEMLAQGVSKASMARRLDVDRPHVTRLVNMLHRSKIEHVERALAILGKRIALQVVAA
ncbi:TPA: type II toxin-antitoxin system HicB family antitoxin [Pseudomonas aeruginosa]|uniref:type II toxin-antitoxin system HicB family antitoxin n=1 Tax=Pseudomonas aeruginosa TaxID=287 RepID=UPI0027F20947|nr:type II toxin-antitoxin system HicB family antitoxin [Pseudomonas aeruginosa]EKY4114283.1 type II toxin-antitoxin system HicB family antitoxin [Pseudomonas aeruginosa]ELJ2278576.1 type II toxin-antitoxin system HicB family antitoxin [Pseudomonas aeruginosa]MBX6653593.1 type II toxin-antitoxin system HicB family antitoxin [Pseudomonas aeruginosa]MCS8413239.1 type II toxin-antitoxin system HicB family antitoxin [Pseudomonas aeruginosa]